VISETKKKLKGSQELDDYILLYSGVPTNERAAAGIAIMIKAKFKKRINSYVFVNERILQLRYKLQRGYLTLLGVYASEEGKTEHKMADTYHQPYDSPLKSENISASGTSDRQYCEYLKSEVQVRHKEVKSLTNIINLLNEDLKVVGQSNVFKKPSIIHTDKSKKTRHHVKTVFDLNRNYKWQLMKLVR